MIRFAILTFYIAFISACGGVKLIDIPKTASALNLTPAQQETIAPKISVIRDIVEDYEFEKDRLESHYHGYRSEARMDRLHRYSGGATQYRESVRARNTLRIKIKAFITQRNAYLKEVAGLVNEIRAALTPEQVRRFAEIKLPDLKPPSMLRRSHFQGVDTIPGTRPFGRF